MMAGESRRIGIEDRLYRALGQLDEPYVRPPLCGRRADVAGKVCYFGNDGFDFLVGTPSEWQLYLSAKEFRQICFWYLYQWAFVDWFGLRSFLWYKLLSRRCAKHRRIS